MEETSCQYFQVSSNIMGLLFLVDIYSWRAVEIFYFASFLFDRIVGKFSIENYVGFRRALIWFCAWLNQENQLETENMKNQNSDALDASGFSWPPLSWSPAHDETSI